jgi:hypothetical protein
MVSELGGSFQGRESSSRKLILGGLFGMDVSSSSPQWKISEEVLPERLARSFDAPYGRYTIISLSIHNRYLIIAIRTNVQFSVDIVLRIFLVQVIFRNICFAKKHGACVDSHFLP